jgi:SPP1 gp7 family putative phage head morphogenesis protein
MVFKASKKREIKPPEPVAKGLALIPSAAIRIWYHNKLLSVTEAMVADYRMKVKELLKDDDVRRFFAQDAAPSSLFKRLLDKLFNNWEAIFDGFATETADEFVEKSDEYASASVWHSLSTAGVNRPTTAYNSNVTNTLGSARDFNHTLITGIADDVHEKVYEAVMLSLTSPNPEEQGVSGIMNALDTIGGFAANRVKLIATDQTSKVYASLSDERMKQNNVEEFEWMHSSAGKEQRESHVRMDGHIFKLDDPRLWEVGGEFDLKKGDLGPPGWAIHCRCRKRPIII